MKLEKVIGTLNAKRNPNQNHKTIVLDLFSFENLKEDLER